MRMYIDCEFNEFKGDLISMALVAEDGSEFYEVLECKNPGPWVSEHVMPFLNKEPIPHYLFKELLFRFLRDYETIEIIADWPDDIKHFCEQVIVGPGMMMNIPSFACVVSRDLSASTSKIPHNALEDARAIWESAIEKSIKNT